jgi:hypothetical protein
MTGIGPPFGNLGRPQGASGFQAAPYLLRKGTPFTIHSGAGVPFR